MNHRLHICSLRLILLTALSDPSLTDSSSDIFHFSGIVSDFGAVPDILSVTAGRVVSKII